MRCRGAAALGAHALSAKTGHDSSAVEKEGVVPMKSLLWPQSARSRRGRGALVFMAISLTLGGCGFHLRTASEFSLPRALSVVRVTMPANGLKYPGLVLAVRRALLDRGVKVVNKGNVPSVTLLSETMTPLIVTMNNNGGATAYLLDYEATFSVQSPHGRVLMPPSAVRVQREYPFDPLNILAMAREQAYLEKRMRIAAARQIVWRLSTFRPTPKAARHAP